MERNLKLSLKLFFVAFFVVSCGSTNAQKPHKCQLVVVLDKTNSVNFASRFAKLEDELSQSFIRVYQNAMQDIQFSKLKIVANTSVFPDIDHFSKNCPKPYPPETRSGERDFQNWQTDKKLWIMKEVKQTMQLIKDPCNNNTTDVFAIFDGLQQIQQNNGPWDSITVLIFSDMINTTRIINMKDGITVNNAFSKGKSICQSLLNQRRLTSGGPGNLHLTIYVPDNMTKTVEVHLFWKGFFEQWGLREDHYNFQ